MTDNDTLTLAKASEYMRRKIEEKTTMDVPRVRLSIEANKGTPALASMIAAVLKEAGATVTFGDKRIDDLPGGPVRLVGLHVHIDRLTWVQQAESERWGT